MKTCGIFCILAAVVIIANVIMTYYMSVENTMKNYEKQLSPELSMKYIHIANERKNIYFLGHVYGFVLSIFLLFLSYIFRIKSLSSSYSYLCFIIIITHFTSIAYYVFSPKSDWMLNHIQDEQQAKAWLNMYQYMKNHYHTSYIISVVAVSVYLIAFGCDRYIW